jgi:predicted GH43/DUF377 family glycosyl hydrolase
VKRSPANPILTREDVPDVPPALVDATSVFNPGALHWHGVEMLLLRVQTRGRETVLMVAESPDGERFHVRPELVEIHGLETVRETIHHVYDPRLTALEGAVYVTFAADTDHGCRLGIARTDDFERFHLVSFDRTGDTRNGVLFPERVGGRYLRLERPNSARAAGPLSGDTIVLAESRNLAAWNRVAPVMTGSDRRWDELIGAGPPPVKTRAGWLLVYHGVATHFAAANVYQAGVALLDLERPEVVLGRCRDNVLEPREPYEQVGQVPNVVFPSGMIVERCDVRTRA